MKIEICKLEELNYVIRYPEGFEEGKKYPVIMLLHGAGGRGNDINVLLENPFFTITEKHENFPFISVAPLCSANTWFDLFEHLKKLVCKIALSDFTDKEHIYLMGAGMGGYGTWQLAMSMPEFFAAIAPICGGGMYWNASRLINVPVWAFHGANDDVVYPEESKKMVDAVNRCGGKARLTIYPENDHNAWSDTYSNMEVFEWMLSNKNQNTEAIIDIYDNTEMYG